MARSPEEMWQRFMDELQRREPLSTEDKPHTNFLGSASKYRKIFLAANTNEEEYPDDLHHLREPGP